MYEWRSGIARAAVIAVNDFFRNDIDEELNKRHMELSADSRATFIREELLGPDLLFHYGKVLVVADGSMVGRSVCIVLAGTYMILTADRRRHTLAHSSPPSFSAQWLPTSTGQRTLSRAMKVLQKAHWHWRRLR